ncbi:MAG TPA: hypothetical protein VLG38_03345 [Gammaproteobacteria bacterium]|nr:hypothetical protein [Gammaproteobacteria bacterium]
MATIESALNIDIAAEFDASIAEHATAYLLPFEGPTFSELVGSRRLWCAGELVTTTALNIGIISISSELKSAIATAPVMKNKFSNLYSGNQAQNLYGDVSFAGTKGIWFIHRLVGLLAKLDAQRRGMDNPVVDDVGTYGGLFTYNDSTTEEHVDDVVGNETQLRYAATLLGAPTILYRRQLSINDIAGVDYVKTSSNKSQKLKYPGGRQTAVTMFELHTPHKRPGHKRKVRLFTTGNAKQLR